ncbi:MAG: hypothetical protein DYG89_04005 [Caldilinea sp. CFX5]|nr:hypothetical protein [Caldilinea sp. CFX5]
MPAFLFLAHLLNQARFPFLKKGVNRRHIKVGAAANDWLRPTSPFCYLEPRSAVSNPGSSQLMPWNHIRGHASEDLGMGRQSSRIPRLDRKRGALPTANQGIFLLFCWPKAARR